MNEIFGVVSLGRSPLQSPEFERLALPTSQGVQEIPSTWVCENIALGFVGSSSHLLEAPVMHGPTGVRVFSTSRLDNREELFQKLGVPVELQYEYSDGKLILDAYLQYGEGCVEHLLGDWVFAAWDPRDHKLVLARDHTGMLPIHYHASATSLYFSTSIRRLLRLDCVPNRPNLLTVGQMLSTWPADGVLTYYDAVKKLPAAHTLVCKDGAYSVRRYWAPVPHPSLNHRTEDEYIEEFLEIYSEAVRCRLRSSGKVGVTLSGGLDSGSVAALAARELRQTGESLQAFSSVPALAFASTSGRFADESPYIEANRRFFGNMNVSYVRGEKITPIMGIDRSLAITDEPTHAASNAFWILGILEAAQELGIGALLTGQMGNLTVSWRGDRFASPLEKAKWLLLLSWGKPLRNRLRQIKNHGQDAWLAASPLRADAADSLEIRRLRREAGFDPNFVGTTNAYKERASGIERGVKKSAAYWSVLGAGFGIEIADPTFDKRIIEFILATPIEVFRKDGLDRRLLRLAMRGLLPEEVRLNRKKGLQAADVAARILDSQSEIEDALSSFEKHPLVSDTLDLPKMRRVFSHLQHEPNAPNAYPSVAAVLMRGLSAGRFLSRF